MSLESILNFSAALISAALALAVILRRHRSATHWLFFAGMAALAAESTLTGLSLEAAVPERILYWQRLEFLVKSVLPAIWLAFSLTYSRGNYGEFLLRWRYLLVTALLAPVALAATAWKELSPLPPAAPGQEWLLGFGAAGNAFNLVFILAIVLVLTNLEKTFRTAVGTMRWRIKFVVLGLCLIFGVKIFITSQALIYSHINLLLAPIQATGLLLGCALIAVSYLRTGLVEIDVYPSHTFLYSSLTILLSGIYLLAVGLLAQLVVAVGGELTFPLQAFLMLLGIVGLAVLLLSDRFRQKARHFISRHFKRPLYDYRKVWTLFTEKTAHATSQNGLCAATAKLVSDTFNVLSVTVWLMDDQASHLALAASTSLLSLTTPETNPPRNSLNALHSALREKPAPFDLDAARADWAAILRQYNPGTFPTGGHRICVPIVAGEQALGVIVLADRVSGLPFSIEELDLLRCIGSHVAASLLSFQLSEKLMLAREQEAFRAVSAFFAHDLKNAASTLTLMLQNLPQHFDDPAFRADVLRGISKTVDHMNHLIGRLGVLRQKLEIESVPADLNEAVTGALSRWEQASGIELLKELQPLPRFPFDPEQIQTVVTNLALNARDALGPHGQIRVQTARQNQWAVLTVRDNGCGMAPEFLRNSLFRPFQTTKKNGTGIGMFQCKAIIEAHRGRIEVESELGKGTTFRILLPLPTPA